MVRFLPAVALLAIAACTQEYEEHMVRAEQCRAAETYGQMFGTPENRGPCWGPLITTSRGFGMEYYHMRTITGRQAIVMYDGNRLISVTLG
ncbi:MAG: hypothetical protein NXH83_08230 [Rhodobacteraceae bacterium]|nr:hypothetical protein [Paracoccaceae bacterium]